MTPKIPVEEALLSPLPVVDVRSPSEFQKGHIPNAVNIPLFSDEERAQVGTVYKQQSQEAAIALGYRFVTPKLLYFLEAARQVAPEGKLVVHCWRGGMRSQSFAEHLASNGFERVSVIEGGYKAYRNHLLRSFEKPLPIRLLGGYTGSGKTRILKELQELDEQVIDLEGLAAHKGSVFGGIGQGQQPSVEQFENTLYEALRSLDHDRPIWLEDESHNIGAVNIPLPLFYQMRAAVVFFLEIPKEERAKHLVEGYAHAGDLLLREAIVRISGRLGGLRTQQALDFLAAKDYYGVALLTLDYYDKYYLKGLHKRGAERIVTLPLPTTDPHENALHLLTYLRHHE
jgi:tRNA 2-selenouridine synthase